MPRQLNEELFSSDNHSASSRSYTVSDPSRKPVSSDEDRAQEIKSLKGENAALKRQMNEMKSQLEGLQNRLREFAGASKKRFEQTSGHQRRLEEAVKAKVREIEEKYASLSGRMTERKLSESKTQEMMDRHHQVVMNFEAKMSQVQKVIQEQKAQLATSQAALKEARREIEKLKGF